MGPTLRPWEPMFMESPEMPQVVFIRPKQVWYGCFVNCVCLQPCIA